MITLVAPHLESSTSPQCRQVQMKQILNALQGEMPAEDAPAAATHYPIVMAGDLNVIGYDMRDKTLGQLVKRETIDSVKDDALAAAAIADSAVVPFLLAAEVAHGIFDHFWTQQNPTRQDMEIHIGSAVLPIVSSPEGPLFVMVKKAIFTDTNGAPYGFMWKPNEKKYYFDSRVMGAWSATNAREDGALTKDSAHIFQPFEATEFTLGKHRIDWFFVAPQGDFLRPAFPETTNALRKLLGKGVWPSDHTASTVLLNIPN